MFLVIIRVNVGASIKPYVIKLTFFSSDLYCYVLYKSYVSSAVDISVVWM